MKNLRVLALCALSIWHIHSFFLQILNKADIFKLEPNIGYLLAKS